MNTIHVVFHAHLDPIWMWPWTAGLDEALATCRSACERLEGHSDLYFSQGEAWIYQMVERADQVLFQRIREHIAEGRWNLLGGWWTQPDCNLPSGPGLAHQIELGKRYFTRTLGHWPRVGFNPDTFGHAASLPSLMRAAGQDRYIMMRPEAHEMQLPARLFRWREREDAPEVLTYRIAHGYNGQRDLRHLAAALDDLPAGIAHGMCFMGLGDHGGGPTEEDIAWIRAHRDAIPGARLEFSTPDRFFDAVADQAGRLPVVTGELQHHAIGCFSVHRAVTTRVKRAEHLLVQAQSMALLPAAMIGDGSLDRAWERVCSHQFHDTLGGTALPTAYAVVDDQLGEAAAIAEDALQYGLRRLMNGLPDDTVPRMVFFNASDLPFSGHLTHTPWLEHIWRTGWHIRDEQGEVVPFQAVHYEGMIDFNWQTRTICFHLDVPPGAMRVLRLCREGPVPVPAVRVQSGAGRMVNDRGVGVDLGRHVLIGRTSELPLPRLDLIEDGTDTWSHGIDRYSPYATDLARWRTCDAVDDGPILASMIQEGMIGTSGLRAEWRVHGGGDAVELLLDVNWQERQKVLKLSFGFPSPITHREDGIPGSRLVRKTDGRELPLRDWTRVDWGPDRSLGIVAPDVFALDVSPRELRLTLLRSPWLAHHDPHRGGLPRRTASDQGAHRFRFRFHLGDVEGSSLERDAHRLLRPLISGDLTRGMKSRFG